MIKPLAVVDLARECETLAPGVPSRMIGRVNESCLKLSVYEGDGVWHAHPTSDEVFVVLEGELTIDVYRGTTAVAGPRQIVTVPAGVIHRPRAAQRSVLLCFKHTVAETEYYEEDTTTTVSS